MINEPNDEKIREFIRFYIPKKGEQDSFFKDWKDLRNPATHGKKIDLHKVDNLSTDHVVLDLCYSIVLCRISYLDERMSYANPYSNIWSVRALNPSDDKSPLGSLVILSRFSWIGDKHRFRKTIPVGENPKESIELIVRPHKNGGQPFKIEVCPREIMPDEIAKVQMRPIGIDDGSASVAVNPFDRVTGYAFARVPLKNKTVRIWFASLTFAVLDLHCHPGKLFPGLRRCFISILRQKIGAIRALGLEPGCPRFGGIVPARAARSRSFDRDRGKDIMAEVAAIPESYS